MLRAGRSPPGIHGRTLSVRRSKDQEPPKVPSVAATALRILVVDDEADLRAMLERSFAREGHEVVAVPDGEQALEQATADGFDVVLLDVALGPGPSGYDVARELRA